MKLKFAKRWFWLTLVAILLALSLPLVGLFMRHEAQMRAAKRIEEMGGTVLVRWDGWSWLFHFASDDCRGRFKDANAVSPWGPASVRSLLGYCGFDAFIRAWDVANEADFSVDAIRDVKAGLAVPEDVPGILAELQHLPTLRELTVHCRVECELDFGPTCPPLQTFVLSRRQGGQLPRGLPTSLKTLIVYFQFDQPLPNLKLLQHLSELQHLELYGAPLEADEISSLSKCQSLTELAIHSDYLSVETLAALRELRSVERLSLQLVNPTLSGLLPIKDIPNLKSVDVLADGVSPATAEEISKKFPQLTFVQGDSPKTQFPFVQARNPSDPLEEFTDFSRPHGGIGMF